MWISVILSRSTWASGISCSQIIDHICSKFCISSSSKVLTSEIFFGPVIMICQYFSLFRLVELLIWLVCGEKRLSKNSAFIINVETYINILEAHINAAVLKGIHWKLCMYIVKPCCNMDNLSGFCRVLLPPPPPLDPPSV